MKEIVDLLIALRWPIFFLVVIFMFYLPLKGVVENKAKKIADSLEEEVKQRLRDKKGDIR